MRDILGKRSLVDAKSSGRYRSRSGKSHTIRKRDPENDWVDSQLVIWRLQMWFLFRILGYLISLPIGGVIFLWNKYLRYWWMFKRILLIRLYWRLFL